MNVDRSLKPAIVGDKLVMVRPLHRGAPELTDVVVVKVAIKYLTVEWDNGSSAASAEFRRDNGEERGSYSGSHYHRKLMTHECLALLDRHREVVERLRPLGSYSWMRDLSVDQMERIAAILEEGK